MTMRRRRAWCDSIFNISIASATGMTAIDLLADFPDVDVKTVTRILGRVAVYQQNIDGAGSGVNAVDMAIGLGAEEAFNANVLPDPQVQAEYPTLGWLWKDRLWVVRSEPGLPQAFMSTWFDVGAQRKVDKGVLYLVAFNNLIEATGVTVRFSGIIRALCLT